MNTALDFGDRAAFLNIVTTYKLTAPRKEHQMLDELFALVCGRTDCFDRYREDGACHLAASVFLMDAALERGLFIEHRKIGQWTQPGGHADGERDIYRVACREVLEEVGVTIEIDDFLSLIPFDIRRYDYPAKVYGYPKSIINLFFLARIPHGQSAVNLEPEHCGGVEWATPERAAMLVNHDPVEMALIRKWELALASARFSRR